MSICLQLELFHSSAILAPIALIFAQRKTLIRLVCTYKCTSRASISRVGPQNFVIIFFCVDQIEIEQVFLYGMTKKNNNKKKPFPP